MIDIEHGIPIPDPQQGRMLKYPWESLGVGDSFFVPDVKVSKFATHAWYYGKRHNKKFATRSVIVDGKKGVRVWRTG